MLVSFLHFSIRYLKKGNYCTYIVLDILKVINKVLLWVPCIRDGHILSFNYTNVYFASTGGQAIIALCKNSKHHQDQICEGNGVGPLVRLLRNPRVAEGTLLSIVTALGTMCVGMCYFFFLLHYIFAYAVAF